MRGSIPNSMQEVRRNSQWRKATNCLGEMTSERESKSNGSCIKKNLDQLNKLNQFTTDTVLS